MILRSLPAVLLVALAVLAVLNAGLFAFTHFAAEAPAEPTTAWQRWRTLTADERLAVVQRYRAIHRRPDERAILRRASTFAASSAAEQERLRRLREVFHEVLAAQSPAEKREILRLPPRAQAYRVYVTMVAEHPARLSELEALWPRATTAPGP